MKKILSIALVSLLACGALLAGCGGEKKADPKAAGDKTKVAFVYVRAPQEGGPPSGSSCQRRRLLYGT